MSRPVLASCSDTIKLWELPNTTPTKSFNPHTKAITALSWSANNQVLISGSSDGTLSVSLRGAQVLSLEGNGMGPINSVSCSTSSKLLAAGDENGAVHVWELKNRDLLKSFKVSQLSQDVSATCVQFNASDSHIAAGSSGGDVVLYSMTTNQIVANFQVPDGKESGVRDLKYSPFSRHILAACSDDGGIHMWDTHTRKLHTTFPHQHTAPSSSIAYSPVNKLLLTSCGLDKKILFYDVAERKVLKIINTDSPLTCLSFMEDGITLAAGSTQGKIFVYDLRTGSTPLHVLKAYDSLPVNALQFQHAKSSHLPPSTSTASQAPIATPKADAVMSDSSATAARIKTTKPQPQPLASQIPSQSLPPQLPPSAVPSYMSDVAAFSPIKGKGGSAPPPTPSHTSRDEHHREVMLKAQRALQQPLSGMASKSLQALNQYQSQSATGTANGVYSSSDNLLARPLSSSSSIPANTTSPSTSPTVSPIPSPVLTTNSSRMLSTGTMPKPNSPETVSPALSSTFPGPRSASTPSHPRLPSSTTSISLNTPTLPSTAPDFDLAPSPITPTTTSFMSSPAFPSSSLPTTPSVPSTIAPVSSTSSSSTSSVQSKSLSTSIPTSAKKQPIESLPTDHINPTSNTHSVFAPTPMDTSPSLPPATSPTPRSTFTQPTVPITPPALPTPTSHYNVPLTTQPPAPTPLSPSSPPVVPIQDVQRNLIKSVLAESLDEFKASLRQDVQNLHLELIRQFQIQQLEMREMLEHYVQNSQKELIEEIKTLRQENNVLRQRVFY